MNAKIRIAALFRLALATDSVVSDDKAAIYIENTEGFDDDTFVAACRSLEKSATWFPKCAELRAACAACQPKDKPIQRPLVTPMSQERAEYWLEKIRVSAGIAKRRVKP